MKNFYLFVVVVLLLTPKLAFNQTCDTITATYVVTESRCASTGSIEILATGGSGNYQYKVSGPINTNYTSLNLISGLSAGKYLVTLKDIVSNCVYDLDSVTVAGNYIAPGFSLVATGVTCINGNDGTITATGQTNGRAPFSYKIIAPSASKVGTVSATGVFTGLIPGNYLIQLSDSCGAIQTRSSAILNYDWSINNYSVTKVGCDSIAVTINLIDSRGNSSPNAIFSQFSYGASKATGDTTWYSTNSFRYFTAKKHVIKLFAKDKCGVIKFVTWTDNAIPSVASSITISNRACSTFTGRVTGQNNLTAPDYCIYDNNNVLITCNTSGTFNNLPYGSYCIRITDVCWDTTITRCFTVARSIPSVNANVQINANCLSFTATVTSLTNLNNPNFCLYNSSNVLMYCNSTGVFPNLPFGQYCIRIVNDPSCYDTTIVRCFTYNRPLPSAGPNVTILNRTCTTVTVVYNDTLYWNNPTFCLYRTPNILISCNSTGRFDSIPYGSYCIEVQNGVGCYDTLIRRCFTIARLVPSVSSSVSISNRTCTTFRATVSSQTNLTNPQFCLYDNVNALVSCNTTGVFSNIPYGSYCIKMQNDSTCYDTLITRCFSATVNPVVMSLTASNSCVTIGTTDLRVSISSGFPNYSISLFSPTGSLIQTVSTGSSTYTFTALPGLLTGQTYKVVVTDQCGNKDSTTRSPQLSRVNRVISIVNNCPSGVWPFGSGNVLVDITDNNIGSSIVPKIIKKNGAVVSINATTIAGYKFTFSDLGPGTYIFETFISACSRNVYDTTIVSSYLYPTLSGSKAYQCDNNGFSVNATVWGGTGPYLYEIIGSVPTTPSIVTAPQASPVFNINNGSTYSLIRLRVVDACGNAALQDASILPLANLIIWADSLECIGRRLTLRVDLLPGAVYTWYKRIIPNDSAVVGSGNTYTIPALAQGDTGRYFCKVVMNNGCLVKFANYIVTGWCGSVLPVGISLKGSKIKEGNLLQWGLTDAGVTKYELQRSVNNLAFTKMAVIVPSGERSLFYIDKAWVSGNNLYRLKLVYKDDKFTYSNIVNLTNAKFDISVYPNPIKSKLYVSVSSATVKNYSIEIVNFSGQRIMKNEYTNIQNFIVEYPRTASIPNGIYTMIVTDMLSNEKQSFKLVFQ